MRAGPAFSRFGPQAPKALLGIPLSRLVRDVGTRSRQMPVGLVNGGIGRPGLPAVTGMIGPAVNYDRQQMAHSRSLPGRVSRFTVGRRSDR